MLNRIHNKHFLLTVVSDEFLDLKIPLQKDINLYIGRHRDYQMALQSIQPLFYQNTLDVLDLSWISGASRPHLCLFPYLPNQVLLQVMAAQEHPSLEAPALQLQVLPLTPQ